MSETPSGNRWEPADDATQPITPAAPPVSSTPTTPAAPVEAEPDAPAATPEYGWAPPPQTAAAPLAVPRRERRRTGLLAACVAALVLGSGALGYTAGAAASGSDTADPGTTHPAPPTGFAPAPGAPSHDDGDDDHSEAPGDDDGSDDGAS